MKGPGLSPKVGTLGKKGGSAAANRVVEQPRGTAQVPDPSLPIEQESQKQADPSAVERIIVGVEPAVSFLGNPNTDRFLSEFDPLGPDPIVTLDPDDCANVVKVWYGPVGRGVCIGYLDVSREISFAWVTALQKRPEYEARASHDFRIVTILGPDVRWLKVFAFMAEALEAECGPSVPGRASWARADTND